LPAPEPSRSPSRWTGLAPDERRRDRRQLLIDAAFELLAVEGTSGTTVRAVCARARLNPRYFYESFDELDALVVAVYDAVVDQLRGRVREAVLAAGDDPRTAVRASVEATVRFIDEDRRRGRILYVEALGNEALNVRRMQTGFDLVELVQRDTARRRGGSGSEQIDRLGAAMLVGGFSEILAAWLDGRIDMGADAVIETSTDLFVAVGEAAGALARPTG
jgi:AcrR family transcriptional regulator